MSPPRPKIFISYSHKDESLKDELVAHFKVLQDAAGLVEVWSDERISAGQDWKGEIEAAMREAKVAILLISVNFLTSDFILKQEVPKLLARRQTEGMTIVPVLARSCLWEAVPWLAALQMRPKDAKPVWREGGRYADEELERIVREVIELIRVHSQTPTVLPSDVTPKQPHNEQGKPPTAPEPNVQRRRWLLIGGVVGALSLVIAAMVIVAKMPPVAGTTQRRGNDNAEMVFVPAGEFTMGSNDGESDEKPAHSVYLDDFWMDKLEVTNALYKRCVDAGKCTAPSETKSFTRNAYYGNAPFDNYPVIYVSWEDADKYCQWVGKKLPTEAQWEKAARGTNGRTYPWGENFDKDKLNSSEGGKGDTTAVGSYPTGASPYGALDMAGNVWEWVADWYSANYYQSSPARNPMGPTSGSAAHALRGGSWSDYTSNARIVNRGNKEPTNRINYIGFRCAQ